MTSTEKMFREACRYGCTFRVSTPGICFILRNTKTRRAVVVESLAARYSLLDSEKDSALFALAGGQDMTRWGLANAVTQIANTSESYDRSAELMELGGRLMTMPAASYNALASMPKKTEILEGELVHV
jgi:hypothetical protein